MDRVRQVTHAQNVRLAEDGRSVRILDQTLLPGEERIVALRTLEEFCEAIRSLRVRGAPAIGVCRPPYERTLPALFAARE